MKILADIESMRREVATINSATTEVERIAGLCEIAFRPRLPALPTDPFSAEYRSMVLDVYKSITGRATYSPAVNELSPYLADVSDLRPGYYMGGSTGLVGDILMAMGEVLRVIDGKPGTRILEYGAGEGGISLEAAKVGCDVTVVDLEPRYLGIIERRALAAGVSIRTVSGEFGLDCGGVFDVILFYEAFHHSLDHADVAKKIHGMLAPGGRLILAGEPVFGEHNADWKNTLPYPWGLRLDGLSFRAIETYGWLELGFNDGYLIEMLMRAGFLVEYRRSPAGDRGSCYIARPHQGTVELGAPFTIATNTRSKEWHEGEGSHRWTGAEEAALPICADRGTQLRVTLVNHFAVRWPFEVESCGHRDGGDLQAGETRSVTLPASNTLLFRSGLRQPGETDARRLGLAVKSVELI
jgi:2-polyprenyl-3-methyl-5-hydroxy-6-metoxy-1,4-benzoquinol methylase